MSRSVRTMLAALSVAALLLAGYLHHHHYDRGAGSAPALEYELEFELAEAARDAIQSKWEKLDARGPKPMAQPEEASKYFYEQRLGKGNTDYPMQHVADVLGEIRERQQRVRGARGGGGGGAGPGGIEGWNALGPGNIGGRTRALVIDPDNPSVMYAAGVAGGIWKSLDAGASWNATDDLMLNLAVCCLVMDPNDSNVLYAGTGEGFFSGTFVRGLGIFKSTDAGVSWQQLDGTVSGVPAGAFDYVNKIRISPNDSNRLYAATRTGVWRSLDAGATWSVVLSNPDYIGGFPATNGCLVGCTDLAVRSDRDPDVLFAAFGSYESDGLFRSDDGGDTWLAYTVTPAQGRMTLAFAPSNNNVLYICMADNGAGGRFGAVLDVVRSLDGGNTFEGRLDFTHKFSPWLLSYATIALGCVESPVIYSQGWYDNIIAVDPLDPDVVWVGGIDVYRSDDGGRTFGVTGHWFYYRMENPPPTYIHPDQHLIVFHPDYDGASNQTMFVTNDGGIFRTRNARAATSQEECPIKKTDDLTNSQTGAPPEIRWTSLNNGYGVTQYYHGETGRDGADVFVGGAQDNGTSRVLATNTPEAWRIIAGGDGGYVAIDPNDSQVMYVEFNGFPRIFKSVDGGDSFAPAVDGITDTDGLFIAPYAMDLADPDTLWAGGSRPWRTMDGAESWQLVGPDFAGPDIISAVAIAPSNSDVVYLGFTNGYIARTTNGTSPSPTWEIFVNGLVGGHVTSVAVDPFDTDIAYCTYANFGVSHVLRTVNGGQNWTSIDGISQEGVPDIPAHWVAIRPCDSNQLYVGTELGVFASDDGGTTWQPSNLGMPNTVVESLTFRDDNTLVAFTHGRGAFLATLEPCAGAFAGPGR